VRVDLVFVQADLMFVRADLVLKTVDLAPVRARAGSENEDAEGETARSPSAHVFAYCAAGAFDFQSAICFSKPARAVASTPELGALPNWSAFSAAATASAVLP
jgi:hypothetical protein